ncbi:MAG: cellulase family glycosylhydrolase [Candidatus Lernaella stagnicola]|nr:cellulase family glycosylhydrolase [Candidatus Lernaella stagnicola]
MALARKITLPVLLLILVLCLIALAGCGDEDDDDDFAADDDDDNDDDDDTTPPGPFDPPWLQARMGDQAGIFDELGRQVLLRGVNFNHLGDYFETDPSLPTVSELSAEDWDDAAALGHNVVRLVTTWSAWEPDRDQIDMAYLDRVRAAVEEAKARDMYVVIDMHQDA